MTFSGDQWGGLIGIGFGLLLFTASCSEAQTRSVEPSDAPPASEAAIISRLQQRLPQLAVGYPDARLTSFKFSPDKIEVCGLIETPGEKPLVFLSIDDTPATVEDRALAIPILVRPGQWREMPPSELRAYEARVELCRKAGLLPTEEGAA